MVAELCRRAGWSLTHEMIPDDQRVEVTLAEDSKSRWQFQQVSANTEDKTPEPEDGEAGFVHIDHITPEKGEEAKWRKTTTTLGLDGARDERNGDPDLAVDLKTNGAANEVAKEETNGIKLSEKEAAELKKQILSPSLIDYIL